MEAHLTAGAEDSLIEGLKFTPPGNTANYCIANRPVQYFAESGNRFDPVSSRVIRFRLADTGFLESSSVRLRLTVTNQHNANLTPVAQAGSLFRRFRLFAASQLVEDITEYATQNTLMQRLLPAARRLNDSIEAHPLTATGYQEDYGVITPNESRRLIMPLPCGTLNQAKWLPLHLISGGLVIEAELDDHAVAFAENGPYIITDVSLLANLHEIDSSLANSYASHVLRGGPLHVHYSSVVSSRHLLSGPTFSVNLVRGFTRLRQMYFGFIQTSDPTKKKAKDFKSPIGADFKNSTDGFSWQVTIGSRKWPERACTGVAETFMRLRQASACFYGTDDLSVSVPGYVGNQFMVGLDLEKVGNLGATHSGISTKDGSIVQLDVQNSGMQAGDTLMICLVYDGLLSIKDGHCEVSE